MTAIPAFRLTALGAATLVVLAGFALSEVGARGPMPGELAAEAPEDRSLTMAETMFPDAPDGVDPMPTGPVSTQLRQRQLMLACGEAIWPDIPAACYPR